ETGGNSPIPSIGDTGPGGEDASQNTDTAIQNSDTQTEIDDADSGQDAAHADDVLGDVAEHDVDTVEDVGITDPMVAIALESSITQVQPLTGIVLWADSWNNKPIKTTPGNIQLEYAYVGPDTI